jgi:hypothetical protein
MPTNNPYVSRGLSRTFADQERRCCARGLAGKEICVAKDQVDRTPVIKREESKRRAAHKRPIRASYVNYAVDVSYRFTPTLNFDDLEFGTPQRSSS